MKKLAILIFYVTLSISVFGQNDKVIELVQQGVELHDLGKYDEAIVKYKAALQIDPNSIEANYELSYTYMTIGKYEEAITYSSKVVKLDAKSLQEAYIVLGSSYDLIGNPKKAIKAYEEGISKYPNVSLLHYNIALTYYNQHEYDKAESEAIKAISLKPTHGTSHIILSAIMQAKGNRIRAIMPLYYFLMLEPNSARSVKQLAILKSLINQGVSQKDEKHINVNISSNASQDKEFGSAEMMLSLHIASQYTEKGTKKSEIQLFDETTSRIFDMLTELRHEQSGFWWDTYVAKFEQIKKADKTESFCYYISQSDKSDDMIKWLVANKDEVESMHKWIEKEK